MQAPGGFPAFVATAEPGLRHTAFLLTGSPAAAATAVESALAAVHRRWRRTDDPTTAARRALVAAVLRGTDAPQLVESADDAAQDPADRAWLTALGALPARTRAAVVLRLYHGLDDAATADLLGSDPATVTGLVRDGVRALRPLLPTGRPAPQPTAQPTAHPAAPDPDPDAVFRRPR